MEDQNREVNQLLDCVQDAVDDLDNWNVQNNDVLNSECYELLELIKRCRKTLKL